MKMNVRVFGVVFAAMVLFVLTLTCLGERKPLTVEERRRHIVDRLKHGRPAQKMITIGTIANMSDEDKEYFAPYLIRLLDDRESVALGSQAILGTVTYEQFGGDKSKWKQWWEENKNKTRSEWKVLCEYLPSRWSVMALKKLSAFQE